MIGYSCEHQNLVASDFMTAGKGDFGYPEAHCIGGAIAEVLHILGELGLVATPDDAVAHARQKQQRGGGRSETARHLQIDQCVSRTSREAQPSPLIRPRPPTERCTSLQPERLNEATSAFHHNPLSKHCAHDVPGANARMAFAHARYRTKRPPSLGGRISDESARTNSRQPGARCTAKP